MNGNTFLERTLPTVLGVGLLPFLTGLIGCIVCLVSFRRAPRAASWALGGLVLLMVASFGSPLCFDWFYDYARSNHWSASDMRSSQLVLNVAWSLVRAISYGCLLVGVFAQRGVSPQPSFAGNAPQPTQQWGGYPPPPAQPTWPQPPPPRV